MGFGTKSFLVPQHIERLIATQHRQNLLYQQAIPANRQLQKVLYSGEALLFDL